VEILFAWIQLLVRIAKKPNDLLSENKYRRHVLGDKCPHITGTRLVYEYLNLFTFLPYN
jgi:hypothetical protein